MRALVLAAGRGAGLYPFTNTRPKSMLPVAGEVLLRSAVEKMRAAGVSDLVVVVGHRAERIIDEFGQGARHGVTIRYVRQSEPTGIRDAARLARECFREDESFLLAYADVLASEGMYRRVVQMFGSFGQPVAAICHTPDAQNYGTVYLGEDMRIERLVEKPSAREMGNYVLAGLFVMPYRLFDLLERLDMDEALNELCAKEGLRSSIQEDPWLDTRHPWDLLKGNRMVMDGWREARVDGSVRLRGTVQFRGPARIERNVVIESGASIFGPCFIGEGAFLGNGVLVRPYTAIGANAVVGFGVELKNCTLLDGVRVGRMSFVSDSVVGEGAVVGSGTMTLIQNEDQSPVAVRMPGGAVDSGLDKVGSFLGDGARVGASNTLAPGSVVPPGEVIPHHCTWPAEAD